MSKFATRTPPDPCPCGRACAYSECCGRWHRGERAPDAESLMRARYSAYVRGDAAYLSASWHSSTRPAELALEDAAGARTTWLGLEIQRCTGTGTDTAEVEFIARYRIGGGRAVRMREHSRFVREDGRWYYLDAL